MKIPHRWRRAWTQRGLLGEAAIALAAADLRVRWRGGRRMARALGDTHARSVPADAAQLAQARAVGWAIAVLSRRWPWAIVCLPQALAAQRLLRRRQVPCVLHLGLARDAHGRLSAHAWLRCADVDITGGEVAARYAEVAAFR